MSTSILSEQKLNKISKLDLSISQTEEILTDSRFVYLFISKFNIQKLSIKTLMG